MRFFLPAKAQSGRNEAYRASVGVPTLSLTRGFGYPKHEWMHAASAKATVCLSHSRCGLHGAS